MSMMHAKNNVNTALGAFTLSAALISGCLMPPVALAAESTQENTPGAQAQQGEEPPAKPDGESGQTGEAPNGQSGTMSDSQDGSDGQMSEPPDGVGGSDLGEPPDGQGGGQGDGKGGMGGANTQSFDYSGSYTATIAADGTEQTAENQSITATDASTNAALAQNGGTLTITNSTLEKSGDLTDGDSCNFYGVNSVALSVGENSTVSIMDSEISATSEGSNGIFSTDNALVLTKGTTISTTAANSRGLDATYGGTILAGDMTIETQGDHCAAFATDRGGGNVSVSNATVSTSGSGSPLIYSTGAIEVDGVSGTATESQIAGMEGLNTIRIYNSNLTSTLAGKMTSDPILNGIIIYQSTSGDAETSTGDAALFQAVDSTLTSTIESGAMFYLTNTSADVVLENTTLDFDSTAANLITAAGNDSNSWGTAGKNGATATFTGINETLSGDIEVDTISSLALYLTEQSTWTGAAYIAENADGNTSENPISINVDSSSTWVVSENCTVSTLCIADGGSIVDTSGKTVSIVADGATVREGESDITVTVNDSYSTNYDESAAGSVSDASIDRSAYDSYYNTSTTTGNATSATSGSTDNTNGTSTAEGDNWFMNLWNSILSFFGL